MIRAAPGRSIVRVREFSLKYSRVAGENVSPSPNVTFTSNSSRSPPATTMRMLRNRPSRSEEHTSELQSRQYLVCRLLLEKKKKNTTMVVMKTTYNFPQRKRYIMAK